jgi:hypothetical protein
VPEVAPTYLTREQILAAKDTQFEDVDIPEWGGVVRVRGMTGAQRDSFEGEMVQQRGKSQVINLRNLRAKLVAKSLVDEKGALLFTAKDIETLGEKSASGLQKVYIVAQKLSGITTEDVESLTVALGEDPSASSGSD